MSNADEVRDRGYTVLRGAVPVELCERVVAAIRDEVGVDRDDPATWDRVSSELDQVPLWGHQSQWDIRQLPGLHAFWAGLYGTERLWATFDSCRFSPPWRPGRCRPTGIHWDHDPTDDAFVCFQGVIALSDAPAGAGGFCCAPDLRTDRARWPEQGRAVRVPDDELVEVPAEVGDVIVWDWRLPHGNSLNRAEHPRIAFYLGYFPAGSADQAAQRVADFEEGRTSTHWRWKPGHDRQEPGPPAELTDLGRRLLGADAW